jgi:hypothetical protein
MTVPDGRNFEAATYTISRVVDCFWLISSRTHGESYPSGTRQEKLCGPRFCSPGKGPQGLGQIYPAPRGAESKSGSRSCSVVGPGQHPYRPFPLVAPAALRAGLGDDSSAGDLYQEANGCCFTPWLSADAIVGQAAVARRLGDLARARAWLRAAADRYREPDLPAGQPRVLAGRAWWALGAGQPHAATNFAADAVMAARTIRDPETQLLADSALAAANTIDDPSQLHGCTRPVGGHEPGTSSYSRSKHIS